MLSTLSVFIDESGDFGKYERHCPFYIMAMVFHDQSRSIDREVNELRRHVREAGFRDDHAVHTAPLIRREEEYREMDWASRRKLFRNIFDFVRFCDISYRSFVFKRRECSEPDDLIAIMSREISAFVRGNLAWFQSYDRIVVYYDNGQKEISRLINIVLNTMLSAEVKEAHPANYCLLQAADLVCTLELARAKATERNYALSNSELAFFSNERMLKRNYLKPLAKKRL